MIYSFPDFSEVVSASISCVALPAVPANWRPRPSSGRKTVPRLYTALPAPTQHFWHILQTKIILENTEVISCHAQVSISDGPD